LTYLPADSFWALQLLESALVLGLSVALVAVTVVWLRRRAH
jgi:hypothetical protein